MPMPTPIIARHFDAREMLKQKSCFLFGPRQTGKSTLIRQQLADVRTYNLLDQTALHPSRPKSGVDPRSAHASHPDHRDRRNSKDAGHC